MAKKVKSFNVDEAAYNSMVKLLKEYDTRASISFFLDKCLKELLIYFNTMREELAGYDEEKEIMRFNIDRMAEFPLITTPDRNTPGEGDPLRGKPLQIKTIEPHILELGAIISTAPDAVQSELPPIHESELDEEVNYWRDEYEANQKKLSRAFVKHLRSGKFILSQDKKYLIEKTTGKVYVDFTDNYIIEVA